ncbi:MAG TPA: DUF1015 family protein [Candidatus Deferrimicrobium sp.]|nr:DUF1015 family protein [Candidatus Deferrimicrobium sp.]
MARIEPFKGLRPTKDIVSKLASPPYDVLNSTEAKNLTADNPFSFLRISKAEVDLPDGVDLYSDEVYNKAQENFSKFIADKLLIQDKKKFFYLYKQVWGDHVQVGLAAGASCMDYQDDIIKKHEYTREDKEKDRMRHIETLKAHTGPVFLTFKHKDSIDALFEKAMQKEPEYDFTKATGVRHIFYVVDDEQLIADLKAEFAKIDFLYVADGHHRSAAATNVKIKRQQANPNHTGDEEYNFFLAVIFPDNQMKILPYNRVVKDLNGLSKDEFFAKIADKFHYEKTTAQAPQKSGEFCIYIEGQWYKLTAKAGSYDKNDAVACLDVSIMQNNLLDPVLGIKNPRKDKRIDFVGGIRGTAELERLVNSGDFKVAVSFFPTTIQQLFKVADSGKVMPPKSTWFEPKLDDGLVIHMLND